MVTSARDKGYLFHYSAFGDLCVINSVFTLQTKFCAIIHLHDAALGMAKEKESINYNPFL